MSILRRASLGNFHPSPVRFAHAIDSELDHSRSMPGALARSPKLSSTFLGSIGLTADEIELVRYARTGNAREDAIAWNGLTVPIGDLQFKRAKVCVSCFCKDGVSLSDWDHIGALACDKHRVLLLDQCPCCSKPWSFAEGPLSCDCSREAILAKQSQCSELAANLIAGAIENCDQDSILLLGDLTRVLAWWDRLSIERPNIQNAESLATLSEGGWPIELKSVGMHPRLLLAPLFSSNYETSGQHALRMLSTTSAHTHFHRRIRDIALPKSTAERVLGIGRLSLNKLLAAGRLSCGPTFGVSVESINELLINLSNGATPSADALTLSELRAGRHRVSLTRLLDLIDSKEVTNFDFDPAAGISGLRCDWRIPRRKQSAQHVTAKQLAAWMHTNYESIRKLIEFRLIDARKGSKTSAVEWVLDQHIADAFVQKHIFASEIADQLGLPRNVAARRLMQLGINPISGPGIDGGVTFMFRRRDINLDELQQKLGSIEGLPAWQRRQHIDDATPGFELTSSCVAEHFQISNRQVREIVQQGWISPFSNRRRWRFSSQDIDRLTNELLTDYISVDCAADQLDQTRAEFQKTWIDTGQLKCRLFGSTRLISSEEFESAKQIWRTHGTASSVGRDLQRPRWLAANLRKMALVAPSSNLGTGTHQIHLFRRDEQVYEKYDMT